MHAAYYLWINGEEEGPLAWPDLKRKYQAGEILGAALVRGASDKEWVPIEQEVGARIMAAPREERPVIVASANDTPREDVADLRRTAWVLMVLGAVGGGVLTLYDTAPGGTQNLGLLNSKLCLCIAAATVLICGCMLFCAAFIAPRRRPETD